LLEQAGTRRGREDDEEEEEDDEEDFVDVEAEAGANVEEEDPPPDPVPPNNNDDNIDDDFEFIQRDEVADMPVERGFCCMITSEQPCLIYPHSLEGVKYWVIEFVVPVCHVNELNYKMDKNGKRMSVWLRYGDWFANRERLLINDECDRESSMLMGFLQGVASYCKMLLTGNCKQTWYLNLPEPCNNTPVISFDPANINRASSGFDVRAYPADQQDMRDENQHYYTCKMQFRPIEQLEVVGHTAGLFRQMRSPVQARP
jgi:hypothetical protein